MVTPTRLVVCAQVFCGDHTFEQGKNYRVPGYSKLKIWDMADNATNQMLGGLLTETTSLREVRKSGALSENCMRCRASAALRRPLIRTLPHSLAHLRPHSLARFMVAGFSGHWTK